MDGPDFLAPQAIQHPVQYWIGRKGSVAEAAQAAVGSHPKIAGTIRKQQPDTPVSQPGTGVEILETAFSPTAQTSIGTDPETAVAIFAKGAHEVVHQALLHGVPHVVLEWAASADSRNSQAVRPHP